MGKKEKSAKELLGELYSDREYLEKLLKDEGVWFSVLYFVDLFKCQIASVKVHILGKVSQSAPIQIL